MRIPSPRRVVARFKEAERPLARLHGTAIYWSDIEHLWEGYTVRYSRNEAQKISLKVLDELQKLRFPLRVWRGLDLFPGEDIRLKDVGTSWSPVERSARNFGRVLLSGVLPSPASVDWEETLYRRIRFDSLGESAYRLDDSIPENELVVRGTVKNVDVVEK